MCFVTQVIEKIMSITEIIGKKVLYRFHDSPCTDTVFNIFILSSGELKTQGGLARSPKD